MTLYNIYGEKMVFDRERPVITVFCDYCQWRYPFDLLRGGQMICMNCRRSVNTTLRKPPELVTRKNVDIRGFGH